MIGEKIKAFRKLHNLSHVEFSTALGISQGNLNEIEKGNSKPSADTLIALRNKYGFDLNWLLIEGVQKSSDPLRPEGEYAFSLTSAEIKLMSMFKKLNLDEQERVVEFVDYKLQKRSRDSK
ncbi:helix-turn-helix domain-containing protein [Paenibacillus sp. YYML68]|uniref:helix-turn-helix domain-containing protein n=1 Tax=Paenibacillus sp. YYML68 TaxID=2909250 RepID=UPI002491F6E7|nr:helix-turn-helix transcriptional regulator [Paenibacillus sp. YYML68]